MPQARDTHIPRSTAVAGTTFHSHTVMCRSPHVPGTEFLRDAHAWHSASSYVERKIGDFLIRRCKKMRQTMASGAGLSWMNVPEWHYFANKWTPLYPFCLSYLCSFFLSLPLLVPPQLYWFPYSTWFRAPGFAERPEDPWVCRLTSCGCMIAQHLLWLARLIYCHCWRACLVRCVSVYFASWLTTVSLVCQLTKLPIKITLLE